MRLQLSRLQKIIVEEITRAIKERDDKGSVTHYAWSYSEGAGGDDIITKEEIEDENATITLYGDGRVEVDKKEGGSAELEWEEFLAIPNASWDDSLKEIDTHPGSVAFSKDIHQKIIDAAKKAKGGGDGGGEPSDDTGDDDYKWDDEKLKFDLDVHNLDQAPSLSIQGDNVTLETDEYDIEIPKKVFKAFAAKL